jgi:hypothetical protein
VAVLAQLDSLLFHVRLMPIRCHTRPASVPSLFSVGVRLHPFATASLQFRKLGWSQRLADVLTGLFDKSLVEERRALQRWSITEKVPSVPLHESRTIEADAP